MNSTLQAARTTGVRDLAWATVIVAVAITLGIETPRAAAEPSTEPSTAPSTEPSTEPSAGAEEPAPSSEAPAPARRIMKRPYLKGVTQRRWFRFSGHYWRLWGGAETGAQPKGVSAAPDGKHLFVTNFGQRDSHNVYRFDTATLTRDGQADFAGNAIESWVSPDSRRLYVSNFRHRQLLALATDTMAVIRRYRAGRVPKHFALTPDESQLFAANWDDSSISVLDAETGESLGRISVGKWPRGTAITHDGKKAYVANFGDHTISVIDVATREVIKTIKRCRKARHIAITDDDRHVLASCYGAWEIAVINGETDTVERRVHVGNGPKTVAISRDQRFAYTADYRGDTFSIIDLSSWTSIEVPVPTVKTSGLAVSPDDRHIYITGWDSRNLLVFQRLAPGEAPGELGPKPPPRKCYRIDPEGCDKFP